MKTLFMLTVLSVALRVAADSSTFDPLQGQVHRANLGRSGVWQSSGLKSQPTLAWEFKTGGPVRSSPVVVEGVVYVGSYDGNFYALDAATGKQKWSFKTGGKVSGSAAVAKGGVFFAGEDGNLYRLNAADGTLVWSTRTPKAMPMAGSPAILNDTVFIGAGSASGSERLGMTAGPILGFDIHTGKLVWQSKGDGPQGYAAITTDGEKFYTGTGGSYYGSFDIATQNKVGTFSGGHQARQFMSMTVEGDKLYIPVTMRGAVMCLDKNSQNHYQGKKWYTAMLDGQLDIELNQGGSFGYETFTDLAVSDTTVFAGCNDGKLYTFDKETGAKGWTFETGERVQSSPSVANGAVYFGSWDGHLYALDAASGNLLWKHSFGARIISSPWPGDGVIYVGCDNGSIYALK